MALDLDERLAITQRDLKYAVGSGTHAQTFLYEADGLLGESPITWYRGQESEWDMSPGYDNASHPSFQREVSTDCLHCHVGGVELGGDAIDLKSISELTIGCERCHGPGSAHVSKHQFKDESSEETIVNPKSLSRERSEAICQQCHMQGAITVAQEGQGVWDFRPGQLITDNRTVYQYQSGGDTMRIVGHVEQMHASKCYQETETLTCITCHNPHATLEGEAKVDAYRDVCLQCHKNESCGVTISNRMDETMNDCSTCHMPKASSNVSHVALHHHRIGVHQTGPPPVLEVTEKTELVPVIDDAHLPTAEQKRRMAIAKLHLATRDGTRPYDEDFREQAVEALFELYQNGMRDPVAMSSLAWDAFGEGYTEVAEALAKEAYRHPDRDARSRTLALRTLAKLAFAMRDFEAAARRYQLLSQGSRQVNDIHFHGLSEQNIGNTDKAISLLKKAIRIDPTFVSSHQALEAIHASLGQADQARHHAQAVREIDAFQAQRSEATKRFRQTSNSRSGP